MKNKLINFLINAVMVLTIPLTIACQGVNSDDIDPEILEHVKSVIDFYPDCKKVIQVYQFDTWKAHICFIHPKQIDFGLGLYIGRGEDDGILIPGVILPTNALKYKDKYILFYSQGKKALSEKKVCKILGITSERDFPEHEREDTRIWVYMKDKQSNKSVFEQIDKEVKNYKYPQLRYFYGGEQDSAVIDMASDFFSVHGESGKIEKFSSPDMISISMSIFNKSDSILLVGLDPDLYGSFIIKNGKHSIPLNLKRIWVYNDNGFHKISSGLYSIEPHKEMEFGLSTVKEPIILENTPPQKYAHKLYDLFYDSIFYVPKHPVQIPDTVRGILWNKEFKVYTPTILDRYNFWVNDSIYNIYSDGETDKYGSKANASLFQYLFEAVHL
ncbi:hypothetical protein SAMN05444349_11918 [Bacteroides faecichinchillae]|uniref:Lipoprotein n=2 Tax=Bacteroides faecichinchillae TaxID=871325 RepID=A0A1M5BHU4_9BACE|nr:hypothetical protein [Bacteroides faecichinchillae]SHF42193.1 hypothetical protein SAMN05444349_11918 [Bacteroides faecichinchillae]